MPLFNLILLRGMILVCLIVFVSSGIDKSHAAVITSFQNGDWHTGTTWIGGVVPNPNDTVIVNHDITAVSDVILDFGGNITVSTGNSLNINANIRINCNTCQFYNYGIVIVSNTIHNDNGGHFYNDWQGTVTVGNSFKNDNVLSILSNYGYIYVDNSLHADGSTLNGNGNYDVCNTFNITGTFINNPIDRCQCDGINDPFSGTPAYIHPDVSQCTPKLLGAFTANNDNFSTTEASPVTIHVFWNDYDPNGYIDTSSLSMLGLLQPSSGSITNIDTVLGTITYLPNSNHFGADTFQYRVCDTGSFCDTALIVVYTACSRTNFRDTLNGQVYLDINGNGILDGPEVPIIGADIEIWHDVNEDGIIDAGDVLDATTTTDAFGMYQATVNKPPHSGFGSPVLFNSYDAIENLTTTVVNNSSLFLDMGKRAADNTLVGAMYSNLNIPNNALIVQAQLRFTGNGNSNALTHLKISAQYSGNAPLITTTNSNLSSRLKTQNSVAWTNAPAFQNDTLYISPSLVSVVQEFVDHPGWNNSNRYLFLIEGTERRTVYSRDGGGNSKAIYSWIHYSPSGYKHYLVRIDTSSLAGPVVYSTDSIYLHQSICGGMTASALDIGFRYTTEINCSNGIDDDGDGFIDCSDTDCLIDPNCDCAASNDTISGTVFNDLNANAMIDVSDSLMDSVTVELYHDLNKNGVLDIGDTLITTTESDTLGFYEFNVPSSGSSNTFSRRVASSGNDDAYEDLTDGTVKVDDKLKLGQHGAWMAVGTRFTNLIIPKGSFITDAYIEFDAHDAESGLMKQVIYGEAHDNASAYSASNYNISNRIKTVDSVLWDESTNWSQNGKYQTNNISPVVQEILDRPGWNTGNRMNFMFFTYMNTNKRNAKDWKESSSKAPLLVVNYLDTANYQYYIIKIDETTLPAGFSYSTDSIQTAAFICGGQVDVENNFGILTDEICNDSIDNDGDGLIDCADTLDCRPTLPGVITASNDTICEGVNGEGYSIAAVAGATSYDWTVPAGVTITAGQGTTSISVDWGSTSGNVCVRTYNGFCYSAFNCKSIEVHNIPSTPPLIVH